jgi:hypothetical protein
MLKAKMEKEKLNPWDWYIAQQKIKWKKLWNMIFKAI